MKHIRKFNENSDFQEDDTVQVKVKDIIDYLSTLDPDANVYLDKDGWEGKGDTGLEILKNDGIFYYNNDVVGNEKPYLIINN